MTTKAEIHAPLALEHYERITLHLRKDAQGNIDFDVERSGQLEPLVDGLHAETFTRKLPVTPEAKDQIIALIKAYVIPADAEALKVAVAP